MKQLDNMTAGSDDSRFRFGRNWSEFLRVLTEERIAHAERSLVDMLEVTDLRGLSFLDAGSGSGLFSLAALNLGALRVHSFDYDTDSVASTRELKRRFGASASSWTIDQGSVLDSEYMRSLGTFDVVYSWGVLHHTGDMWRAFDRLVETVKPGGLLFVALYNDQGATSARWRAIKRLYNEAPALVGKTLILVVQAYMSARGWLGALVRPRGSEPAPSREGDLPPRGMSRRHDLIDWVGGYPFEVATPEQVFDFCRNRGFSLRRLKTVGGGLANNEFVFVRRAG